MGKPTICISENKGADQLRGNREADQRLCFRNSDSTIPPVLNSNPIFTIPPVLIKLLMLILYVEDNTSMSYEEIHA